MGPDAPLAITGTGAISSVGFGAAAMAAALRCRLNRFEDAVDDEGDEPVVAAPIVDARLGADVDPAEKLGGWMAEAVREAIAGDDVDLANVPVLACLAEAEREGSTAERRKAILDGFVRQIGPVHADSRMLPGGSLAAVDAFALADDLLHRSAHDAVLVVAADSWLFDDTLRAIAESGRGLAVGGSGGMIPGEAAAALLLRRADDAIAEHALFIGGWAQALEPARIDNAVPNLATGLTAAIRAALDQAGQEASGTDVLLTEIPAEPFYVEEACAAGVRTFQDCIQVPETWIPAESLGATGAVAPLLAACWLREAHMRDYHPGFNSIWCAAEDDGRRGALAFSWL